ncbi:MAG: electron transport complex protein RnfC, partial [Flavobacteriales bacterium]
MRQVWDIHGGIHPPENKEQSTHDPIGRIVLPEEFTLALSQHIGAPAEAIVAVGDKVLKGQKIADAQGYVSVALHAPSSGEVMAIEERDIAHSSELPAPCIVIKPDGHDTWIEHQGLDDYTSVSNKVLLDIIRDAGIAGMGGAGFPSAVKLNPRADLNIDTVILNGTECEPYITADDMLMRERANEVVHGAEILAYILGYPKNVIIGIEDNKPEAIAAIQAAAENSLVEIISFPTKYPSGGEKQLIQILTGKEVPQGEIPANIGIVVQNVGTAAAIYKAVCLGEPLISRVTTVVGETLAQQRNIDVLIGTPLAHVLKEHGFKDEASERLIIGGPMMGFSVPHAHVPIVKTTNCVLAPTREELPPAPRAQACIRCGMCATVCPASLLPQQLFWFSQSEDFDKLRSHNLADCIECGACSFVCPSNIPLVQYYRASKGSIRQLDEEKQKSDRSRERFEFRKARIEKAEAEKDAKRLARKKAAELAKT